ncbi:MAG: hypothetical protein IKF39_04195 [Oscillospiraceae bacterium]|nr:hypothetical protein [Oscillospiraceae bacterium]
MCDYYDDDYSSSYDEDDAYVDGYHSQYGYDNVTEYAMHAYDPYSDDEDDWW